ncbi:MAG: hypothetical protein F6K42_00860 [Leptolyngbya sp. SIO1D8]|nr:hypothetical protein [Leptolyngbya sp. SIO1D8]
MAWDSPYIWGIHFFVDQGEWLAIKASSIFKLLISIQQSLKQKQIVMAGSKLESEYSKELNS